MNRRSRRWAWPIGLGLVVVLAAGPMACGEDEPAPVATARAFARAARIGNAEQLLTLVDAQTVARVAQAAERASDQVGGRRSIEPQEMLQVVDVDPRFQVAKAELTQGDEQQAVVELTGADGTSQTLTLVKEDEGWRVRLPLPAGPMGEP